MTSSTSNSFATQIDSSFATMVDIHNLALPKMQELFPSVLINPKKRESVTYGTFAASMEVRAKIVKGIVIHRVENGVTGNPQSLRDTIYFLRLKVMTRLFFPHGLDTLTLRLSAGDEDVESSKIVRAHLEDVATRDYRSFPGFVALATSTQEEIVAFAFLTSLQNLESGHVEQARKDFVAADLLFWALRHSEWVAKRAVEVENERLSTRGQKRVLILGEPDKSVAIKTC